MANKNTTQFRDGIVGADLPLCLPAYRQPYLLSCAGSVQADSRIDPKLEAQVLQIIREHPEAILESLRQSQQAQQAKQQQARREFLTQMQTNPRQIIGQSPRKILGVSRRPLCRAGSARGSTLPRDRQTPEPGSGPL